jgi:hypothetical protein
VKASIEQSAKLKGGATGVGYHQKGEDFLSYLKTKRPYLVLLHARGAIGKIYFPDGGFIDSKKITDAQLPSPPGLFFAAASNSWYLRTSFCNYGSNGTYKAYVGFETTLYAKRTVDFYKYFFDQAKTPGVSAKQALDAAKVWALNQEWWDVGYYSYIYGSGDSLFLGGPGAGSVPTGSEVADPLPFTRWRPITAYELTPEERQAVALADRRPMVRKLRKAYGSRLVVGIEIYPTVYRVAYRLKQNGFLYGVDVDRWSGEVQFEGELK